MSGKVVFRVAAVVGSELGLDAVIDPAGPGIIVGCLAVRYFIHIILYMQQYILLVIPQQWRSPIDLQVF